MPFSWPVDKLALINRALDQAQENPVAVEDDGSAEWRCCSAAFESGLGYMIEQHPWAWAKTEAKLEPAANVPLNKQWDTAYNLPPDLIHLILVLTDERPCVWDLMMGPAGAGGPGNMQLVVNAQGGPPPPVPPQTPQSIRIQYISITTSDPTFATPTFVAALEKFVFAGIYRGLHKDTARADRELQEAELMIRSAQTRHDQQKPKHALYNSRMAAARRVRRPWSPVPGGWSGSGIPG